MRGTTTFRLLAAVAALGLVATGCSDDTEDAGTTTGGDPSRTTVADGPTTSVGGDDDSIPLEDLDLVDDGVLTVCSDIPYSPFEFEADDGSGEYTGFDVELVEAIGEELGVDDVVWKDSVFDTILASLAAGDCDLVASSMTITEERQEQALFSEPYFDADQSLLVRSEDAERFATLEDLAGETIGVQAGTTGETYANENKPEGATVRAYEGGEDLFLPLQSGDIAAVLQDLPVNGYRSTQDDAFVVTETFSTGEQYGFAIHKDNELLKEAVDHALEQLRDGGGYEQIFATWFGD